MRVASIAKTLLMFGLAVRLRHQFHGPPIDYFGLGAAAALSWIGFPGPGEPLLIAGGVLAASHRLDTGAVLLVAFLGAAGGGIAGWLLGVAFGRSLLEHRGPLLGLRRRVLARGDEIFARYTIVAILVTPTPLAGIHRVRPVTYLATNIVAAAAWAGGIGLSAYFIGPTVVDFVDDLGWVTGLGLVALVLLGVLTEIRRRRRRTVEREVSAG